ncbi:MAG TPA: D-alanine--D-alanine ligase [Myxococcota bacterium]|nr:D-alanine--D-alanine ligase [Myxococcota bacterium]
MRKLRVLLLCHEDLVPPESREGLDPDAIHPWRAEFCVAQALRELGHAVEIVGLRDEIDPLGRAVADFAPDVVFNQLVELRDVGAFAVHVVAYLELLGVAYTGCNPLGLAIARDKALAKKLMLHHGIPTPAFVAVPKGQAVRVPQGLEFPMIVKSIDEESSRGVSQASIVRNAGELARRVAFIHRTVGTGAIAERFVAGRELTVGILGNERPETLPVWELHFRNLPKGTAPIATERVKWDRAYQKRIGVASGPAILEPAVAARVAEIGRATYRALGLSGYARLDLRLSPDGAVHVIEANPNADLADVEDFALAAVHGGMTYPELIQRLLTLGLAHRAPGRRR